MWKNIRYKKFVIFIVVFTLISAGFTSNIFAKKNEKRIVTFLEGNTLYVGGNGSGNYSFIQDAIDNASDGDTIFVYSGVYYENILVSKPVFLVGEQKNSCIIDGYNNNCTVTITAEYATINGFTIVGGGSDQNFSVYEIFQSGIRVEASNCTIENNIIQNNRMGLFGLRVTNLIISNNLFYGDGITFSCYENLGREPLKQTYFNHHIHNNSVNGKPLVYYKNKRNISVPTDIGQLIAINCTGICLEDVTISNVDTPILMAFCSFCTIKQCSISDSDGIWMFQCNNNVVQRCNLSNNYIHGITLDYHSTYNNVVGNNIMNNRMVGVMIEWYSKLNLIEQNNLIGNYVRNGYQIQSYLNIWDHNYWDDWIGIQNPFLKFIPKVIIGTPFERFAKLTFPLGVDFHPMSAPYSI